MNDLYMLLAGAGGLILIGVIVQGLWQMHKARQMLQVKPDGNAAKGSQVEPVLEKDGAASAKTQQPEAVEPSHIAAAIPDDLVGLPTISSYTVASIDPLIDAVVTIHLEHPITGDTALMAAPSSRRAGSKPMYFEGLNAKSRVWESLQAGQQYQELMVGLQLANRMGALNEIEYSDFIMKMQSYADALGAAFDAPDMIETVGHARELDQFANDHDAQIIMHLVANKSAWSPSYVQQQAAGMGFVAGTLPGRLVIPAMQAGAPPILTLQYDMQAAMADDPNMMPITHVTLTLDVPQTDRLEQPFKLLYKVAATLSKNMDASVVDEQGTPLGVEAFDAIHQMLEKLYDQLEQRGLSAGSAAARRLFS